MSDSSEEVSFEHPPAKRSMRQRGIPEKLKEGLDCIN